MDIKVNADTVIVFDLDDTLYNELDYLKSAYREIAFFLDPKEWKPLYVKMFSLYRCNINVFEMLSDQYKIETSSLVEIYRNHQPSISLFDGVLDVLKIIKSKEGKIGIITDGRSATQRSKIQSLGIVEYIDKMVISEEIGSEKPSIANFKEIEKSLPGKVYYYIADNLKKDFIGPNVLGWRSVALIDNGKNIHNETYKYLISNNLPHDFVLDFKDFRFY